MNLTQNLTQNLTKSPDLNAGNNAASLPQICHQLVSKQTFVAGYNDGFQAALGRFNLAISVLFVSFIIHFVMTMLLKHGRLTNKQARLWQNHVEKGLFALMLTLVTYLFVSIFIQPYVLA